MELADGGDLLGQVNQHKKKGTWLAEGQVWSQFVQMVKGLKALHELRIMHRDLKCANVFLCRDGSVKLGDMNVSKVATGLVYTQTGTPYYASPEVWRDQPYDFKSDIWSLGCVLYELTALSPPFQASDMQGLYRKVIRGQYPEIPSTYSQDLGSLIHTLLQVNPALRPSCEKLLSMPIILRNTTIPCTGQTLHEPIALLNTIKMPRHLNALPERLPAPHYEKRPRNSLPSNSKPDTDRPPSHLPREALVNRGREVVQVNAHSQGRSMSASRSEAASLRHLSSENRQPMVTPSAVRSASREHIRLPPSPHPQEAYEHTPGSLAHTPNSQVLRGDPAILKAQYRKANIFTNPRR